MKNVCKLLGSMAIIFVAGFVQGYGDDIMVKTVRSMWNK